MAEKLGMLGALSVSAPAGPALPEIKSGFITYGFEGKRIFSMGAVSIGGFRLDPAKIFWGIGAKQTLVYVPSYEMIDIQSQISFPISGIGASVQARAYPATIDLGGGIVIRNVMIGVLITDNPADPRDFDSADVILGMDIIEHGSFRLDGLSRKWSFKTK